MKFRTIDIEGDCNSKVLQQLFPEGNHFDPDTIMWVVTFCDQDYNTLTLVKKLPPTTRVINGVTGKRRTGSYHLESTKVPEEVDGHKVVEFTDWKEYLKEIVWQIMITEGKIYSKGYGKYNYDAMVLKANLKRNNMYDGVSRFIKNVNVSGWKETHKQVKKGENRPNLEYMVTGIRHNIQDSIQLAEIINAGRYESV